MDGCKLFVRVFLGALVAAVWLPLDADAQRSTRSLRSPSVRSAPSQRSVQRSAPQRNSGRTFSSPSRRSSGSGLSGIADRLGSGRSNSGGSQTPILDALLGNRSDNRSDRADSLRDLFRGYDRDRYRGRDDDEFADAYLAVGLANAAVGLIGVLSERDRYRYQGGGYCNEPCPACAVDSRQAAPVTERVLVEEARYEQYEVWIPPRFDQYTGRKLGGGYNETRTRYVPPKYAYREVAYQR